MKKCKKLFQLILCFFLCLPIVAKAEGQRSYTETTSYPTLNNNELLLNYIQEQFDAKLPGYKPQASAQPLHLDGNNEKIYNALVPFIEDIAAGKRTSTEIKINLSSIGITAKGTGSNPDDAVNEAFAKINLDTKSLLEALLFEHPYEFYWFDKTSGYETSYAYSYSSSGSTYTVTITDLTFSFAVASEYASGDHSVNPSTGSTVQKAVNNAQAIVKDNASKPEYQRVYSYKDKICELTSYNHSAASDSSTPYGNPWQLVWVFDGNPSTTVVCEGYAKAFQYLCDLSNFSAIHAYSVTGTMSGGTGAGPHMWNIIHMDDNKNYLVDVTNVDTSTIGNPDKLFLKGYTSQSGNRYNFKIGSNTVSYVYDSNTLAYYTSAELAISKTDYTHDTSVASISLNKTSLSLVEGASETLTATITPSDATDKTVTWTSSDTKVATVSNGKVTAVKAGTATITAKTSNNKTATCTVTVTKKTVEATGISLDKTSLSLDEGESETLTATVSPSDATDKTVTWTSSDKKVATVSNGKVTAVKAGTATITAKTSNGKTATCTVTVSKKIVEATGISLNKTSLSLHEGASETLTVTITPADTTDKTVTWTSSDTNVATVSNGKITAVKVGKATITATTSNGKTATCTVTVKSDDPAACMIFGFCSYDGKKYWFENGIRQGVYGDPKNIRDLNHGQIERGREIYDPKSDGWYWLDAIYDGAAAYGKEVWMPYIYQDEAKWNDATIRDNANKADDGMEEYVYKCMKNRSGKWVRYDKNGKMLKGWVQITGELAELYPEQKGNIYYYDHYTGLMAKGWVKIKGKLYHFDETTGVKL